MRYQKEVTRFVRAISKGGNLEIGSYFPLTSPDTSGRRLRRFVLRENAQSGK